MVHSPYILAIQYTPLLIGLLLNFLGIVCLMKQENRSYIQKVILINLSSVEILTAIIIMAITLFQQYPLLASIFQQNIEIQRIICFIYHVITLQLYNSMIYITLDRFLCVLSPIKYKIHMKQSTAKKFVLVIWIIAFAIAFPFVFVTFQSHIKGLLYSSYVMQAIFLVFTVFVYIYIAKTLLQRQRSFANSIPTRHDGQRSLGGMKYKVPFLITLIFVMFLVVPNYIPEHRSVYVRIIKETVSYFILMLDPIIYIFSDKSLRDIAIGLFKRSPCSKTTISSYIKRRRNNDVQQQIKCNHLEIRRKRSETAESADTICSVIFNEHVIDSVPSTLAGECSVIT